MTRTRPVYRRVLAYLRADRLLSLLLLALVVLLSLQPQQWSALPGWVHWQTIIALAGLMILSRGLQDGGALAHIAHWTLTWVQGERQLVILLVVCSAVLAAVVTNDVALFIIVPIILALRTTLALPLGRMVIFSALAVNAGSTLSPIGNPQNLFLWQSAGVSFTAFTWVMLPLGVSLVLLLITLIPLAFPAKRIEVASHLRPPTLQRPLVSITLVLYPVFLIALDQGWGVWALLAVCGVYALCWRGVLWGLDGPLLLTFILMFMVMGLLAHFPMMPLLVAQMEQLPGGLLTGGLLLSQVISNVPAAIFLERFTTDWSLLAWGVNVGGFGLAIGSMANIIALRLAKLPGIWWDFHRWSLPVLALSWLLALALAALVF